MPFPGFIFSYLGALVLFVLGVLCIWHTSPYSRVGGAIYEKRRKRRGLGVILLFAAVLLLGMGVLTQFFSGS
jgi:accessory gene regulator protein AgrB